MLSSQVIQTSIDELKGITKIDLCVFDREGRTVASTFVQTELSGPLIMEFADSIADSQVINGSCLFKIADDGEAVYILMAKGSEDAYMIGKIAVSQIQNLMIAYKEKFDRNNFFQNLILDNMLLVDIYNRAKKLHIPVEQRRVVYMIETRTDNDSGAIETLKSLFTNQNGDYLTTVDEQNIILVKALSLEETQEELQNTANMIVDMLNSEAMLKVKVAYGTVIRELKEVSRSYKEAKMALDVGKIFYAEKTVIAYNTLGIGRLIYQLPVNLCEIFIREIFGGEGIPEEVDEEILTTMHKFFENNLNISETARQLFVHRNTLVYRIEKLQKATGLDIRIFDDALTFKIALMVLSYMNYLDSLDC